MIEVTWIFFKSFLASSLTGFVYIEEVTGDYSLYVVYQGLTIKCYIGQTDKEDFETNFKASGNIPKSVSVTTQFEQRDKTVKFISAQSNVDNNGDVTVLIKSPGIPGSTDGRWISGGTAWFDDPHKDDRIMSIVFTDEDNILGHGAGTVIGSYTDDEAPLDQQGLRIPSKSGFIEVEAIGGYGFAPAGFYLKLVGKKGGGLTAGTLYVNIEWGKQE